MRKWMMAKWFWAPAVLPSQVTARLVCEPTSPYPPAIHQKCKARISCTSDVSGCCSSASWFILTIGGKPQASQDVRKIYILPRKHSRFPASISHPFYLARNGSTNERCLFPCGKELNRGSLRIRQEYRHSFPFDYHSLERVTVGFRINRPVSGPHLTVSGNGWKSKSCHLLQWKRPCLKELTISQAYVSYMFLFLAYHSHTLSIL